jgi:hypothetical protein
MSRSNVSSLVSEILNPTLSKPSSSSSINHTARNRAALKQIQEKNREEAEKKRVEEENKELFKMARFKQVSSAVKENLENQKTARVLENENKIRTTNFLKKGSRTNSRPQSAIGSSQQVSSTRKSALPSKQELQAAAQQVEEIHSRTARNFISSNAREAIETKPPELIQENLNQKHANFGQLPKYLVDRKAELEANKAAKEAAKNKSAIKIPPGMKLLTEEERLSTLEVLNQNLKTLQNQLERFPLAVDTLSRKKAKAELEGKIKEIEQAIELFSRKVVFISE